MSENVGAINYTVEADTEKLLSSTDDLDANLNKVEKRLSKTDKAADKFSTQMTKSAQAVRGLGKESEIAKSSLSNLSNILGGILTIQGINSVIQMAEGYTEMSERIRMASNSVEEYSMVQERLLDTANRTYRALKESQEVYILTADTLRSLGYTTSQALDITDSLSYLFVKNATAADRAENATRAFSNAMMKGKLEADGWSSIIAAVPSIIGDVAKAAGISAEEVRNLGASGKLGAQMLSEGLRKSVDENKAAADGMSTTVKDAMTAIKNSLSVYIGEANNSTGATTLLSKSLMVLADNVDVVVTLLLISGAGALAKFTAGAAAAAIQHGQNVIAARAHAAAELELARSNATATAAALAQAQATQGLTMSHGAARAAADAHAAAETRLAAAKTAARTAGVGLVGILGGPAGLIGLAAAAATAIAIFGNRAETAKGQVDLLTVSVKELSDANIRVVKADISRKISELESVGGAAFRALANIGKLQEKLATNPNDKNAANWREELDRQTVSLENARKEIKNYKDQLVNLEKEEGSRKGTSQGFAPVATTDPEVSKRLDAMRKELELAKLSGEARAKLAAIQKLGEKATDEEKAQAAALAEQIYKLENARTANKESIKKEDKAAEQYKSTIDELATSLVELGMTEEEIFISRAKSKLSPLATKEEVANVENLARAYFNLKTVIDSENQQRQAFGKSPKDAEKYITGNTSPLSGGQFDEQTAKYEAERQAEIARYEDAQARLIEAKELKIETLRSYDEIELEMAAEHASRLAQIDQAKNETLMKSGQAMFDSLLSAAKNFAGESSGVYRAIFAVSKAFSIAQAAIAVQTAIANAAASGPFPWNLSAMASVASAVGGLVSSISSVSMGSGKLYGGAVSAGKAYRINETGKPEILNTASGKQFLLPNSRGKVVSNSDAVGSSNSSYSVERPVTVNQAIYVQGTVDNYTARQIERRTAKRQELITRRLGNGA